MPASVSIVGKIVRSLAPLVVVLGGVGGLFALAMSREAPKPRDVKTPPPLVETVPVSQNDGGLEIAADGVVVPFRNVTLSSEVEGRVVAKSENCREGRTVKAGEVLLEIDPANYELEISRLESEREQTKANLAELAVQIANADSSIALAREEVELHQEELKRLETGSKRGAVTTQVYDAARRAELTSRTGLMKIENDKRLLEASEARLQQAVKLVEAQLEQAELDLTRTVVKAPGDGVICSTSVEKDGYLKRGDPIGTFEDTAAVEVRTNLEMRVISWLRAHLPADRQAELGPYDLPPVPVTVTYDVMGNTYAWRGVLSRVEGFGVDERTRTMRCRVHVDEPRGVSFKSGSADLPIAAPPALVHGMYVKVLLHTGSGESLLSVPEEAVRPDNTVWAVRDGKLARFSLPAARVTRGAVLVAPQVTALKPGDRVVVSPLPVASEGMAVRINDLTAGPGATETANDAPEPPMTAGDRAERESEARR